LADFLGTGCRVGGLHRLFFIFFSATTSERTTYNVFDPCLFSMDNTFNVTQKRANVLLFVILLN
jgi:hypothetical protein